MASAVSSAMQTSMQGRMSTEQALKEAFHRVDSSFLAGPEGEADMGSCAVVVLIKGRTVCVCILVSESLSLSLSRSFTCIHRCAPIPVICGEKYANMHPDFADWGIHVSKAMKWPCHLSRSPSLALGLFRPPAFPRPLLLRFTVPTLVTRVRWLSKLPDGVEE